MRRTRRTRGLPSAQEIPEYEEDLNYSVVSSSLVDGEEMNESNIPLGIVTNEDNKIREVPGEEVKIKAPSKPVQRPEIFQQEEELKRLSTNLGERIKFLDEIYEKDLLSEEEYVDAKKRLLEEVSANAGFNGSNGSQESTKKEDEGEEKMFLKMPSLKFEKPQAMKSQIFAAQGGESNLERSTRERLKANNTNGAKDDNEMFSNGLMDGDLKAERRKDIERELEAEVSKAKEERKQALNSNYKYLEPPGRARMEAEEKEDEDLEAMKVLERSLSEVDINEAFKVKGTLRPGSLKASFDTKPALARQDSMLLLAGEDSKGEGFDARKDLNKHTAVKQSPNQQKSGDPKKPKEIDFKKSFAALYSKQPVAATKKPASASNQPPLQATIIPASSVLNNETTTIVPTEEIVAEQGGEDDYVTPGFFDYRKAKKEREQQRQNRNESPQVEVQQRPLDTPKQTSTAALTPLQMKLAQLNEFRQQGILSEEEYLEAEARIYADEYLDEDSRRNMAQQGRESLFLANSQKKSKKRGKDKTRKRNRRQRSKEYRVEEAEYPEELEASLAQLEAFRREGSLSEYDYEDARRKLLFDYNMRHVQ